jgi:hypothetical protein
MTLWLLQQGFPIPAPLKPWADWLPVTAGGMRARVLGDDEARVVQCRR